MCDDESFFKQDTFEKFKISYATWLLLKKITIDRGKNICLYLKLIVNI